MVIYQRPGMSVIEVLVALGMASLLIFSVGNLVAATHRLNKASNDAEQATLLAQGQLEQMLSFANSPVTAGAVFVATNDGTKKYHLDTTNATWVLQDVTATPGTFWLTLTTVGGDKNIQTVTAIAQWVSISGTHLKQASSILTDWKNLVP